MTGINVSTGVTSLKTKTKRRKYQVALESTADSLLPPHNGYIIHVWCFKWVYTYPKKSKKRTTYILVQSWCHSRGWNKGCGKDEPEATARGWNNIDKKLLNEQVGSNSSLFSAISKRWETRISFTFEINLSGIALIKPLSTLFRMSVIDLTKLAQLVPLNDEHHAPVQEPLPQIRRNRMSRSCSDCIATRNLPVVQHVLVRMICAYSVHLQEGTCRNVYWEEGEASGYERVLIEWITVGRPVISGGGALDTYGYSWTWWKRYE